MNTRTFHVVSGDRDERLVEALRHGESSAAERLVATYQDRAYRLALRIARRRGDRSGCVLDGDPKIHTFRGESAFGSWLYRIVANCAYRKLRHRRGPCREIALGGVLPVFDEDGRHAAPMADWSAVVDDPAWRAELRLRMS